MTKKIVSFVIISLSLAQSVCGYGVTKTKYIDYNTFSSLISLVPELSNPRIASLEEGGQKLWARGQMRVPTNGIFLEGDFNQNGRDNIVLIIASGKRHYIFIAERTEADLWNRVLLIELQKEDRVTWNGQALKLGPQTFVAWDKNTFLLVRGPQARYTYEIEPTYKKMAKDWIWSWSPEGVNLLSYIIKYPGKYQIKLTRNPRDRWLLLIQIFHDQAEICKWATNRNGAFLQVGGILYYTEFAMMSSGMFLVAYDLSNNKQLWKSKLKGIGPIGHSEYFNWGAHLEIKDDVIQVIGKESAGSYVEFIYRPTGKTIAHKVFRYDVYKE